jgi:hypothetical protein
MLKLRMAVIHLPPELSPHSFRVGGITDLLSQGVPLEDVQPKHPSGTGLSGLRRCGYYFGLRAPGACGIVQPASC